MCLFVFPKFQRILDTLYVLGMSICWDLNGRHSGAFAYNWGSCLMHYSIYNRLLLIVDVMIRLAVWLLVLQLLQFNWLLHFIVLSPWRNFPFKEDVLEASVFNILIIFVLTVAIGNDLHVLDSSFVEELELWWYLRILKIRDAPLVIASPNEIIIERCNFVVVRILGWCSCLLIVS